MKGPVTSQWSAYGSQRERLGAVLHLCLGPGCLDATRPMEKMCTVNKMYTLYVKWKIKGTETYNVYIIKYNYHNF